MVFIHYITEYIETRCCKFAKKMLHTLELVKNTFYLPWSLCCFMGMFIFKRTDFFFKLIHAHIMFTQKIVLTISKMTFNKRTNMFKYLFTWNSRCSLEYDVVSSNWWGYQHDGYDLQMGSFLYHAQHFWYVQLLANLEMIWAIKQNCNVTLFAWSWAFISRSWKLIPWVHLYKWSNENYKLKAKDYLINILLRLTSKTYTSFINNIRRIRFWRLNIFK